MNAAEGGRMLTIKLGYRAMNGEGASADPALKIIATAQARRKRIAAIIHGGGDAADKRSLQLGYPLESVRGHRKTEILTLEDVVIPVFTEINNDVTAKLNELGLKAQGFTANESDTTLVLGTRVLKKGFVAKDPFVDQGLLESVFSSGSTPVVAPLVRSFDNFEERLNINADLMAAAFPGDLLFVTDTPGVRNASGEIIEVLTVGQARSLIDNDVITGGMIPKAEAAEFAAVTKEQRGLDETVVICDVAGLEAILNGQRAGTRVVAGV